MPSLRINLNRRFCPEHGVSTAINNLSGWPGLGALERPANLLGSVSSKLHRLL